MLRLKQTHVRAWPIDHTREGDPFIHYRALSFIATSILQVDPSGNIGSYSTSKNTFAFIQSMLRWQGVEL